MKTVLVTGGTGFLGAHCVLKLLNQGYQVRTTVRSKQKAPQLLETLKRAGAKNLDQLEFFETDLNSDSGWVEAIQGCDYVLHVASPFPMEAPKNEDDLIIPAREGTLRVLRAARDSKVKRVVVTSSFAAVGYGHENKNKFNESDWTDLSKPIAPYLKSKTLAEKAAWDFIKTEGQGLELTVVNPVGIFGPPLTTDLSASVSLVKMILDGKMPMVPKLHFGIVDVRDVAELEILAMLDPKANGERFIAVNDGGFSLPEIAKVLKLKLGSQADHVSTRTMPDLLVKILAPFNPKMKALLPQLGHVSIIDNSKAKIVLGWKPRTNSETILASAEAISKLTSGRNANAWNTPMRS